MSGTALDGYDLVTLSGKHYRALRSPQRTFPTKFPDGYMWMLHDTPQRACGLLLGFGRMRPGQATHKLLTDISSAFEAAQQGSGCVGFGGLYLVGADQQHFLGRDFHRDSEYALSRFNERRTEIIAQARYHPVGGSNTFFYFRNEPLPSADTEREPDR